MQSSKPVVIDRLDSVRAILAGAFAQSRSDYGGLGKFWELPLPALEAAKLNGVSLIAPEKEAASCCGKVSGASRSQRSGLIQGLRGQPPFDGSVMPRLPWGAPPVKDEDIELIAEWIDDGCPAESRDITYSMGDGDGGMAVLRDETISPGKVDPSIAALVGGGADYVAQPGELKQRVNMDCMTPDQLAYLRQAFRELYELNKWAEDARSYNNLAQIHQNHCQHGWERFLPWHRVYLYEFEQALQDRCPGVTLPYWDFTMPQYRPATPEKGLLIPLAHQAFLTAESLVFLSAKGIPAKELEDMVGRHFARLSDFFTEVAARIGKKYTKGDHRDRFIDALLDANALWYPLRYPAQYFQNGKPGTINQVIHYHYPTAEDIAQILSLRTFRDFGGGNSYNDAFGFLDQNPHNTMHIWTGGMNPDGQDGDEVVADRNKGVQVAGRLFHSRADLYTQPTYGDMFSNLTASYDPVFWPIHVNIDRLWWEWQESNPNGNPADLDSVLTPWSYTIGATLDPYRFGYEYVRGAVAVPVGLEIAVGRYVSRPLDATKPVAGGAFRRAEVRLHRVPQLPRSCFVRVFLNLPDADADTPLDHSHYAGYLAIFGHGPCYGGPGHCDLPGQPRAYDRRPRNHNTPRNHRIDVTACVRRLLEEGQVDKIQISLVVIGADYREESELLRMAAISLNFLD